jgi:hypothetical protein
MEGNFFETILFCIGIFLRRDYSRICICFFTKEYGWFPHYLFMNIFCQVMWICGTTAGYAYVFLLDMDVCLLAIYEYILPGDVDM